MHLSELQETIAATYGERDRARGTAATVAWLCEELGELAQAVRKGTVDQQRHELSDVLAWLGPAIGPTAFEVGPELRAAFAGRFGLAVVTPEDEEAIARRYGVQRWPTLVFLRDGQYVTALSAMRDWDDYLRDVAQALQSPVTRAPGIGIPLVSSSSGADAHCH